MIWYRNNFDTKLCNKKYHKKHENSFQIYIFEKITFKIPCR